MERIWDISAAEYLVTQACFIAGTILDSPVKTTVYEAVAFLGQTLGGWTGSLFYMSTLAMLYLHAAKLRPALLLLGNIGRISLTGYLLHSIIGTFLFLGYGFGVAKDLHPAAVLAISFGVYAILLGVSS